jgi:hypothetical protein
VPAAGHHAEHHASVSAEDHPDADEVLIIYEGSGTTVREIFMDGRPLPPKDAEPWWNGYSVGRWDGDTLVIESPNFLDGGWLDVTGSPSRDQGKLTERISRPSVRHAEDRSDGGRPEGLHEAVLSLP